MRRELTDGLTFPQLVVETAGRMPRDATVLALLPAVSPEVLIALTNLKRRGLVVSAIVNVHDEFEFAAVAGPLLAAGIDAYHLKDEAGVATVCRRFVLR